MRSQHCRKARSLLCWIEGLGQDQNDFRFRLLKLVLERSGTPFALGFSAAVQPQDEAIAALAEGQKAGRRNTPCDSRLVFTVPAPTVVRDPRRVVCWGGAHSGDGPLDG